MYAISISRPLDQRYSLTCRDFETLHTKTACVQAFQQLCSTLLVLQVLCVKVPIFDKAACTARSCSSCGSNAKSLLPGASCPQVVNDKMGLQDVRTHYMAHATCNASLRSLLGKGYTSN